MSLVGYIKQHIKNVFLINQLKNTLNLISLLGLSFLRLQKTLLKIVVLIPCLLRLIKQPDVLKSKWYAKIRFYQKHQQNHLHHHPYQHHQLTYLIIMLKLWNHFKITSTFASKNLKRKAFFRIKYCKYINIEIYH